MESKEERCSIAVLGREFPGWIRWGSYRCVKIDMSGSTSDRHLPVNERRAVVIFDDDKVEISEQDVSRVLRGESISIHVVFDWDFKDDYKKKFGEPPSSTAVVRLGSAARTGAVSPEPAAEKEVEEGSRRPWDLARELQRRLWATLKRSG